MNAIQAAKCSPFRFGLNPKLKTNPGIIQYFRPNRITKYNTAGDIQEQLVRQNLDHKREPSIYIKPLPTLLTYEMHPVYTCGRRERGKVTNDMIKHFEDNGKAEFVETYRGGQTTFHGPGQLVVYPIIDLKSFGITPKCYVSLLEQSIIDTLKVYGIDGMTTNETGVWVTENEKVAAIGVHVRRNITSHGIALNINTDTYWFDRIVACGLPDKRTTTMQKQLGHELDVKKVADTFAKCMGTHLQCTLSTF